MSVFLSLALCVLCELMMSMCAEVLLSRLQTRDKLYTSATWLRLTSTKSLPVTWETEKTVLLVAVWMIMALILAKLRQVPDC